MIRNISILLFLAIFTIQNFAQEEIVAFERFKYPREKEVLSISIFSILDVNSPSIQFGLDSKLSEVIGIHQELGYVSNWFNPLYTVIDDRFSNKTKRKNGVKYILEPRFYFLKKNILFNTRVFLAPSFNFRYVHIGRDELVSRYNNSFREQIKYQVNNIVFGSMLKFGFTSNLKDRRPLQFAFGLGFRMSNRTNNLPPDAELFSERFISSGISGSRLHPDMYLGLLLNLHYFQNKLLKN